VLQILLGLIAMLPRTWTRSHCPPHRVGWPSISLRGVVGGFLFCASSAPRGLGVIRSRASLASDERFSCRPTRAGYSLPWLRERPLSLHLQAGGAILVSCAGHAFRCSSVCSCSCVSPPPFTNCCKPSAAVDCRSHCAHGGS
jgi:hypothetical protein